MPEASAVRAGHALALEIDRGKRRKPERPGERIVVLPIKEREFEHRRDQDDAARRICAALLQRAGERRRAETAIALAHKKDRRQHAGGFDQIEAHEVGKSVGVLLNAPKLFLVLRLARAAVAGAHGIDKDEVGHIEPGARIVGEGRWGALQLSLGVYLDRTRADAAEMQIGRGGAWSAVEHERDGALGVLRLACVSHIEDVRRGLAVGAGEGNGPGFRRVVERNARDLDGVVRDGRRRQKRRSGLGLRANAIRFAVRTLCIVGALACERRVALGQVLGEAGGRGDEQREESGELKITRKGGRGLDHAVSSG